MIIDDLSNTGLYSNLHPRFGKAFEYVKKTDLLTTEPGKYAIADGLTAIFSDKAGMTAEASASKFECHDKFIDIQICIRGEEMIGWKPRHSCSKQRGQYNAEKDVIYYDDTPDMYFNLTDNQFAIFFPSDVHAPMINVNDLPIRKLVIKVQL